MSIRKQQIDAVLMRAVSKVLITRLADPRIEGMISVTKVDASPDLRDAIVHVSIMPDKHERKTLYGLNHAAGHIARLLDKEVQLRRIPRLEFRLDRSIKKESEVLGAIQQGIELEEERARARAQQESSTTHDDASADADPRHTEDAGS